MKNNLLLLASALFLAACSQSTVPTSSSTGLNVGDAQPIPVATAQMLALQMQFRSGLHAQSIDPDTMGLAEEEVADLDGHPLYHLTLLGEGVKDFWTTVNHPLPNQAYQIYATGALDKRDFYSFILNESWFENVRRTLAVSGTFKNFVSPAGGQLYLVDQAGHTWDIDTATEVPESTLAHQRSAFEAMLVDRQRDGTFDGLQMAWKKYDAAANATPVTAQSIGAAAAFPTLNALTLRNGTIDVKALVSTLRKSDHSLKTLATSAKYPSENANCEGWFCAGMRYSGAVRKNPGVSFDENNPEASGLLPDFKAGDFGNRQFMRNDWGRYAPNGGMWVQGDALTPTLIDTDILGCGPTAVMRLFNWYAQQRSSYTRSPNINLASNALPINNNGDLVNAMTQPIQVGQLNNRIAYVPEIDLFLNSKFLINGTFTRDTDIIPGVNRWIQYRASQPYTNTRLYGNSFAYVNLGGFAVYSNPVGGIAFSQYTWQIRDLVRDKIGHDNEPVIAMSGFSMNNDTSGHIYLSQAYLVHEGWFSANVLVWVTSDRGDGRQGSFVNITDAAGTYGGAWALDDHPATILPDPPPPTPTPEGPDRPERG